MSDEPAHYCVGGGKIFIHRGAWAEGLLCLIVLVKVHTIFGRVGIVKDHKRPYVR